MARKAKKDSVIVSLTSFGPRMKYVPEVVNSILNGTMKPYKILLTLTEPDSMGMSDELRKMVDDGVIELLISDSDIKGHKKYFDAMLTYRDYPIITIDDDYIYESGFVEKLYNSYKETPDAISCGCVRKINLKDGKMPSYKEIQRDSKTDAAVDGEVSHSAMWVGCDGAIFPPNCLKLSENDITCINHFVTTDDIVLLYFAMRAGVGVKYVAGMSNEPFDKSNTDIYDNSLYVTVNQEKNQDGLTPNEVALNELIYPLMVKNPVSPSKDTAQEGISVCITAYKTKGYIKKTLDSIAMQTWFMNHDCFEILVGVDGDQELCDYLRDELMCNYKNIRVFMMEKNVGTYTTTNTIMKQAKYSNIIRFDSDDVMRDYLVESVVPYAGYDIVRFGCCVGTSSQPHDGIIMIRKAVFDEFGGYMPWRCAGDTQLLKRLKDYTSTFTVKRGLYDYTVRKDSLTHASSTNMSSQLRADYRKRIAASTYPTRESAKITCVTSPFTEIFATKSVDKESYLAELLKDRKRKSISKTVVPPAPSGTRIATCAWNPYRRAKKPLVSRKEREVRVSVSAVTTNPSLKSHRQGQPSYVAQPAWSYGRKKK